MYSYVKSEKEDLWFVFMFQTGVELYKSNHKWHPSLYISNKLSYIDIGSAYRYWQNKVYSSTSGDI